MLPPSPWKLISCSVPPNKDITVETGDGGRVRKGDEENTVPSSRPTFFSEVMHI